MVRWLAGVWMVCLVFFQCVLLLGYAYAHWITRRAGARQFMVHISLLVVSCLTLPIIPGIIWKGALGVAPEYQILGLLAATVGLPYFLLASTSPLLQRWLSGGTGNPVKEHSIYRLFALSNFGSLVGLFSYPVAIEPFVSLRTQAWVWSGGYLLFVACCVYFALQCRRYSHRRPGPCGRGTRYSGAPQAHTLCLLGRLVLPWGPRCCLQAQVRSRRTSPPFRCCGLRRWVSIFSALWPALRDEAVGDGINVRCFWCP